ncbi:unnamed protein product [Spodoptera exigua]|nr:unnamed protein product [Spodoptera exigua]
MRKALLVSNHRGVLPHEQRARTRRRRAAYWLALAPASLLMVALRRVQRAICRIPRAFYITTRLKEHIRSVKKMDIQASAVAEHVCGTDAAHFIRFDKVSVLAREKYFVPRKVREAIEISRRPCFNRDGGWALPPAWKPSLETTSVRSVSSLECDTVSVICNTDFVPGPESNPLPAPLVNVPCASTSSHAPPPEMAANARGIRQMARWTRRSATINSDAGANANQ